MRLPLGPSVGYTMHAPEDFKDSWGFHTFGVLHFGVLEIIIAIGLPLFLYFSVFLKLRYPYCHWV